MASSPFEMDPLGDAELVVRNPNSQTFFSLPTAQYLEIKESLQISRTITKTLRIRYGPSSASASRSSNTLSGSSTATGEASTASSLSPILLAASVNDGFLVAADDLHSGQDEDDCPTPSIVRFRVSSKHLTLASSVFHAMLNGKWKESVAYGEPLRSIPASDWDVEALQILLNIVHGHHRKVPETLDLEVFAKFATIVDYYDCHEIVEIFVKQWQRELRRKTPEYYGRECLLYMCVAWVFRWSEPFEAMTELALRHSDRLVDTINLPIAHVLESIDEKRQDHIYQLLKALDDLRNDLCDEKDVCSAECSNMLLGSLMKAMHKLSPLDSPLLKPYRSYSLADLIEKVSNFQSPRWYAKADIANNRQHVCNLSKKVQPIVDEAERRVRGFRLEDF